jgi:selenide,water dikinase
MVLGQLVRQEDPNVLVGFEFSDDAGVYRLSADTALVQTVDFFTPIVDDPHIFGQIAATNALSDIYAMGGRPLTSLALVCFPDKVDLAILERILAGGLSKMAEAGCTIVGGHSVRDEEMKFGYSVTGLVHPQKVLANRGARAGDRLLLTKALGTGVISTAIKKGTAKQSWIDAAVASMTTLNKMAAEIITGSAHAATESPYSVHSLTDITGFGLIGHAREMALASNVSLRIHAGSLPLIEGAMACIRAGYIPGGLKTNRDFAEGALNYEAGIPDEFKALLFDPQTAGGLLISVAADDSTKLTHDLDAAGVLVAEIGEVLPRAESLITVAKVN